LTQVIKVRSWSLQMPPLRLALAQVIVGTLNFACVAACFHQALAAVSELNISVSRRFM
jgi:glycosyltransferase 2 family protein